MYKPYKIVHKLHDGTAVGEAFPNNLAWGIFLNQVGYCNYDLDANNPLCNSTNTYPYLTDYELQYAGVPIQAGIHVAISKGDPESNMITVAGKDWLHYLEQEWPFIPSIPTQYYYVQASRDIALIVKDILDTLLALPNSLALTYVLTAIGQNASFKIEPADNEDILSKITNLSQMKPGFDFEITPARVFKLYAGNKGTTTGYVLELGQHLYDATYENSGPDSTSLLGYGQGPSSRMGVEVDSTSQPFYRRWRKSTDFSNVRDLSQLTQYSNGEADRQFLPVVKFSAKVQTTEFDALTLISIGDSVLINANFGWTTITNQRYRIVGMENTPTDEGDDELTLTFEDATISL